MLEKIAIRNYKCHKATELKLNPLTVLCGQNGAGKSSVLQSLLLLRQSHGKSRLDKVLDLNSPLCYIGRTKDALYQFPDKSDHLLIEFSVHSNEKTFRWEFDASSEKSFLKRFNKDFDNTGYEHLALFNNNFQFVSAARSARYLVDEFAVEELKQISIEEGMGELTAQFLDHYGKTLKVGELLRHPMQPEADLLAQATAWEREISTGVNIHVKSVGENFEIRYSFDTEELQTQEISSRNVGYGLSYALPVVVAILSSDPGSLILIENPEAHLHPYGQAKLAELLCLAASYGIQIIVETHSDHIINGILVQCKKFEESGLGINREYVGIYSLSRNTKDQSSEVEKVEIITGGRLSNKPTTFFDQLGKDIRRLH